MRFEHLSRAEQRYEVEGALPKVLAEIDRTAPTVVVVGRVARLLGADPAFITGLVMSIAKEGHPCAKQDGETFKRYGKTMKRWTWRPLAPVASAPVAVVPQPVADPYAPLAGKYAALSYEELETVMDEVEGPELVEVMAELARRDQAPPLAPALPDVDTADW